MGWIGELRAGERECTLSNDLTRPFGGGVGRGRCGRKRLELKRVCATARHDESVVEMPVIVWRLLVARRMPGVRLERGKNVSRVVLLQVRMAECVRHRPARLGERGEEQNPHPLTHQQHHHDSQDTPSSS